jgi:hypothetical protein
MRLISSRRLYPNSNHYLHLSIFLERGRLHGIPLQPILPSPIYHNQFTIYPFIFQNLLQQSTICEHQTLLTRTKQQGSPCVLPHFSTCSHTHTLSQCISLSPLRSSRFSSLQSQISSIQCHKASSIATQMQPTNLCPFRHGHSQQRLPYSPYSVLQL